ncbi:hypothetical protein JB92DRAFT_2579013, partial [Gautieria morchelliformis]
KFYQKSFDNRPIFTLICTNAILNAVGRRDPHTMPIPSSYYDPVRTIRFAVFGATMGPVIGKWMKVLELRFPLRSVTRKPNLAAIVKSVASDQLIMAPLGLVVFLGSMGIMEGRTSQEIKQKYTELYASALLANWSIWPIAQLVNFRYMPLAYRVPFQSTCGIVWTLYLSLLNSR